MSRANGRPRRDQGRAYYPSQYQGLVRGARACRHRRLSLADLRHVWATWHVQIGTPLFALQELGGWESPEMVRRYAHLAADHLAPYAQRLGTVRAVGAKNDGTNTAQRWRRVRCCYLAEARREWCC